MHIRKILKIQYIGSSENLFQKFHWKLQKLVEMLPSEIEVNLEL